MRWIPVILLILLFGAGGTYVAQAVLLAKQKGQRNLPEVNETSVEREAFATISDKALTALLLNAVEDTDSAIEAIIITSSEARTWPDGCLGLGIDEVCTQSVIEGYRVVLSDGENSYTYRMSLDGSIIRRE